MKAPEARFARKTAVPLSSQRGAALLLFLLLILVGGGVLFAIHLRSAAPDLEAQRRTATALARAKNALLGWAVVDGDAVVPNPGRLPCPDQDNDGHAQGAACASPHIGWLPWKTLGSDDLRDGSGERLWLLVDAAFRSGGGALNSTVQPALLLDGRPVVAVIFAPGPALSEVGQIRPGSGPYAAVSLYGKYVEGYSPAGASVTTASPSPTYNDRVLGITAAELFTLVTQRMARELARANPPGPTGYTATSFADLAKPAVWSANQWDAAVDPAATTVSASAITLKFINCGIVYTITGETAVSRSAPSC